MCARCFHATNHLDHNVSFFIAQQSGGCCDCGDTEEWRIPLNCPYHPPSPDPDIHTTPKINSKALAQELLPVKDFPFRVSVPPELHETMRHTVGYALDFILDTLDFSPDEFYVPVNETDLRMQPSADPMMKDQYCVVLWNDDKHSFEEVIKLLRDMTNRTQEEASAVAHRIDENGREVIDMNTNVTRLLEMAQALTQIDLGVTIRRAYDTFREQVVDVIIEWLLDLTRSRLGTDTLILREVIAAELLLARRRDTGAFNVNAQPMLSSVVVDVPNATRLDSMFLYHTRLWKKPRLSIKEIYSSVTSLSRHHKLAIGGCGILLS
jgi:E3 ubiquitin-protein ligase UBR1